MNRSIRRHLKEHMKYFLNFFWASVYTLGGQEKLKKLNFLHFCQVLDVFWFFNQYNDKKSTKSKLFLKYAYISFKKVQTPLFLSTTWGGGLNAKILSKKA